ncbi:hypothetical protein [Lacipirellula parvula]|uniref:Uncharacterized protein n=1 Tax=Lacipirellula parvula TaxID=2650471 RepID=A0A5K7XKK8_9BACT|nr:hypothetical protein [Lacipirellula parvula]BBO35066.1 hypothetical protein PLANPX_4678 [Lacipirellula parvula]
MNVARLLLWIGITAAVAAPRLAVAQEAPAQQQADDITPTEESASPWGWMKMPTVTMPKISWPKMPADPLAPIKSSAKKVSDGGKKAWEGTKEIFTGGKSEQPATSVADASASPSWWERLTGGGEKKQEPEGPATINEWMAQKRVE